MHLIGAGTPVPDVYEQSGHNGTPSTGRHRRPLDASSARECWLGIMLIIDNYLINSLNGK